MKKLFLYTVFLHILFLASSMNARVEGNDKNEILKIVKAYISVTDHKDSTALAKSFHPDAKLLSVNSLGNLKSMTLEEWWSRISRIPNPVIRKSTIRILDISGVAAVVKVEFTTSSDYISLLKINNEWKIVNKILSIVL
jgi:hypothetical protein